MSSYQQVQRPQNADSSSKDPQTYMWQQGHYLGGGTDSGIQSGATTQAPGSLTGHEDDMEAPPPGDHVLFDMDQGYPQGYTQQEVDGKQKGHLVRSVQLSKNLIFFLQK